MTTRLLITGSRTWADRDGYAERLELLTTALRTALHELCPTRPAPGQEPVLVHGGARGADLLAADYWEQWGLPTEMHRANWPECDDSCPPDASCRRDGMLRASARVRHPGVAISFTSGKHGPLTYPCDAFEARYYGESWQANLRAIALGLQHLRALDRYGIAGRGEQYAGWRAIPAAGSVRTGFDSADDALRWLASFAGISRHAEAKVLVREAYKKAHPDVGGDPADMALVDAAKQLLQRAGVIS